MALAYKGQILLDFTIQFCIDYSKHKKKRKKTCVLALKKIFDFKF